MGNKDPKADKRVIVELAGREITIRRVPMARIIRFQAIISDAFAEFRQDVSMDKIKKGEFDPGELAGRILQRVAHLPHALLAIFVDYGENTLPLDMFLDEDDGVDFPEWVVVMNKALELNKLDALKNVFSRLLGTLGTQTPRK